MEDIKFHPEYEEAVAQRMTAEVNVQKQEQQKRTEQIQADIAVIQAKGRADANVAEATARATATTLNGNAEASAIKARSAALADNPALIALTAAEKWDGKLPSQMIPGGAVPFVSLTTPNK